MEDNTNLNTNTETTESSAVDSKTQETTKTDVATETKENNEKTFSQEDIEKIISKRLERERKKAEAEKLEAEKLAKMSEAERQQALFDKEKAKFEEERKQYQREKMELEIIKQMNSKGLPTEFASYLIANDAETALDNIKTFEAEWQKAIEKAVNEKLKGNTPKAGSNTNITITREDFLKMNFSEQNKFANENPEQYKQIMK
ncbi:DUF4355 domain-containing protein [Clostridium sp. KNHs214]|uniref:DUF4355 domain-containing protein n=1 Tax=Clostridium sp. KNHs214 TaxID=1540257 RepID=UPI00068EE603|nr:DUF4355 domain-containing protein [Clostridium sp. KNHs214]